MTASKAVAKQDTGVEIEGMTDADIEALNAGIVGQVKQEDISLPLVRLAQGLSNSVEDGIARAGEFVNSLTDENYGSEFEFVCGYFFYGKAFADKDKNFFGATAGDIIPASWPHKDAGKPFAQSDDFEDNFKRMVDNGEREWGSGPPISTTYNFVGYRPGEHGIPLRLSFMRSSAPAGQKILTLFKLSRAMWSQPFVVSSTRGESDKGTYYVAQVSQAKTPTDPVDVKAAIELARNLSNADAASFDLAGDSPEDADGGVRKGAKPVQTEDAVDIG
jgi:hypothetical protein